MPLENVTAAGNVLTITEAGNYEINYNLLVNANEAATVEAYVRNANTEIAATSVSQTLLLEQTTTVGYNARLTATTIVALTAGATLDLALEVTGTLPGGLTLTIDGEGNATLSVKKLDA